MTALSLEFHPLAHLEAIEAYEWYARQSLQVAERFVVNFDAAIDQILDGPERWPLYESGARWHLIRKYPYMLVYVMRGNIIRVIAVAHTSREPDYWTGRL